MRLRCLHCSGCYFYPRPPRGGRRRSDCLCPVVLQISIHALREEGDCSPSASTANGMISIHALREEGDLPCDQQRATNTGFLSTPSARRATNMSGASRFSSLFLSTPSARRATVSVSNSPSSMSISIHALREEGDPIKPTRPRRILYFYPRPPRGGRQHAHGMTTGKETISIHALREEGDFCAASSYNMTCISIHALREEGDIRISAALPCTCWISIHALREEGDSKNREKTPCFCLIIHLPAQIAKRCL